MSLRSQLQARAAGIADWLKAEAPYATADQKHLDQHSPERAYWHYGYRAAILDVIRLADELGVKTE